MTDCELGKLLAPYVAVGVIVMVSILGAGVGWLLAYIQYVADCRMRRQRAQKMADKVNEEHSGDSKHAR